MTAPLVHHDTGKAASGAGMATKKRQPAIALARLRRIYIDCRYGQLHLATAYPSSGGFDEATPLVFLHAEDGTGADFNRCAELLGTDRSVYAPDLPGSGASDAPKGRMAVAGLALAIVDLVEQLRLRRIDLVGCGRGALVAFELAATHPQAVRRIVVAGTQQPATAIPQPMLQLSPDPARVLEEPADAVAGEIRAFLDRA
jgi:pimeloyl-ACP methyl ester carboxylesterase